MSRDIMPLANNQIGGNMNTTFTVRLSKDSTQKWDVDLGAYILEGKSDAVVRALAEQSEIINKQGAIRRTVKIDSEEAIEGYLHKNGYPDATVTKAVETESMKTTEKRLIAKYGKEKAMQLLEELLGE
jgi:hypothetical protein